MKKLKTAAVVAGLIALTAFPRILETWPQVSEYKREFSLLFYGHALAGAAIVIGAALAVLNRFEIARWPLVLGCIFASYGKVKEGWHFEYPLPYSIRFSHFDGFESFTNGYTIHIPFIVLAILLVLWTQDPAPQTKPEQTEVSH